LVRNELADGINIRYSTRSCNLRTGETRPRGPSPDLRAGPISVREPAQPSLTSPAKLLKSFSFKACGDIGRQTSKKSTEAAKKPAAQRVAAKPTLL
jgi:hypothetical protein